MVDSQGDRSWLVERAPAGRRGGGTEVKVALERRAQALGSVPLFSALSKRDLREVARAARGSLWPAGTTVVVEGGQDAFLAVIVEGEAEVVRDGRVVATLGAGDFFGEVALLDPGPRTATVRTVSDTSAVDLPRDRFLRLVEGNPRVLLKIAQVLARRLRESS